MKDADQSHTTLNMPPLKAMWGVLNNPHFRWLVTIQVVNSCAGGTQTIFGLYYLMFVAQYSSAGAATLQIVYVVLGIGIALTMVPPVVVVGVSQFLS